MIVGGGAVGCGVAYSLAEARCKDILLLERADDLGQVTTSQGAGLCGQPRDSVERIKLAMVGGDLASCKRRRLEAGTGMRSVHCELR